MAAVVATSERIAEEAIELALDPSRNPYRLETLNVSSHSPLMRTLEHAVYTFRNLFGDGVISLGPAPSGDVAASGW